MMKRILFWMISFSFVVTFMSCDNKKVANSEKLYEDTISSTKKNTVLFLQPYGNFSQTEARKLCKEMEGHLKPYMNITIEVLPSEELPDSFLYKPRNRYWADKIISSLSKRPGDEDSVYLGLTHRDISTSIHGYYNWGVMGLSYRPGKAGVISTFRLKRESDLWKVCIHEFFHTRGLPHCPNDDIHCIMHDAHGKNTMDQEKDLCTLCRKMIYQDTRK